MKELMRDPFFGHCVRILTNSRFFEYPEEVDSSIWKNYVHLEKPSNIAHYGQTSGPSIGGGSEQGSEAQIVGQNSRGSTPSQSNGIHDRPSLSATQVDTHVVVHGHPGRKIDPEKGKDYCIVDYENPKQNPQNWSTPKKFFVTFEICFLTFSVYIGSAIYTAGLLSVVATFGVSHVAATLGLALFVMPQIGRNPVYIVTLALFVVLQVPTALAANFGMILAFRFLTGFVGSPSLATGGASIGDMYSPAKRPYGLAVWGIGAVCGPTLDPLLGRIRGGSKGVAVAHLGADVALGRDSCPGIDREGYTPKAIAMMTLVRPFALIFAELIVFALSLYIALIYGLLYIWFESFPIVFVEIYGFGLGLEGLAFLGVLVGIFIILPPFYVYFHWYIEPKFNEDGELKPEWRLPPVFVRAFAIPICLFWFGWSGRVDIHWVVPIIGTAWFSIGALLLFNCVMNYLSDAYPDYIASILAGNDFLRSGLGAAFPLFATSISTLAFISVAFIPIPFVLFKYGEWLRHKSKHAQHGL
ncbi:MFS transporter [Xylariaceae sp. FL1651]|nr:MFS transporter [Xylariaceae sp. FL1651]